MEQLEEELTCPICCGLFEDPRVLLCSHSFCRKCLDGLLEGPRGLAFTRTLFRCPTCRKESPHNGANSLQVNYSLRGIVEKYTRIKVAPKTGVCVQHSGQPLNMFCVTDLRLICGCCATADEHRGHEFCSLEEAYDRERCAFEDLLRSAEGWPSPGALARLEMLQAAKKNALQAVNEDAERVSDYFDRLVSALECKKNEILCDFETQRLAVMQAHDPEITRLRGTLERQRSALTAAEAFRRVTEPLGFLEHMHDFRQTLGVLKAEEEEGRTPPNQKVTRLVRNFDVRKWDTVKLRDVDKMTVPYERECGYPVGSRRFIPRLLLFLVACMVLVPIRGGLLVLDEVTDHLGAVTAAARELIQEVSDASSWLVDVGQQCIAHVIDSTVTYIGS
uniref:tripartite motif-containing 13 n=1 Tax=Doryrhamphus excisus TaxID=161450 RepID=UPI0025ADD0C6|nr:tripartite motif-containing 13 [Doryrhamphus excisus]XP_057938407.1 tripartite motif-containing 13 [Doryrhamphus excisus]XP_057938408.1 tripartite motif-containing 13 [Doryrhamphus excisus]